MDYAKLWNDNWQYIKKDWNQINPAEPICGESVMLPHTWYQDDDYYQGEGAYQKLFYYEKQSKETENRIFLKFYGVDKVCEIFLNGTKIGAHEGGYTMFAVELTEALISGQNILTVMIGNGKDLQVSPCSGDFAVFGGIHRNVEWIDTKQTCFDRTYYGTDGVVLQTRVNPEGKGELWACDMVSAQAGESRENYQVRYELIDHNRVAATASVTPEGTLRKVLEISKPVLWNGLNQGHMYTVRVTLVKNEEIYDSIERNVGFRTIEVDPEKGFFLNHEHVKLHGVAKHQDTAGVYSAATMEHWKTDMSLIGEIGANAVRLSHYPHPKQVYDLCDEMGIVVWSEIPLLKLTEDAHLFENAKEQLTEMIYQNMHHPSICFWGLQNEIAIYGEFPYMTEKMQQLNTFAHQLDDTRYTTSSNLNSVHVDSSLNRITDVTAYNVYYGWYYGEFEDHAKFLDEFHRVNPNMPLGISEYGADTNTAYHSEEPKVNDYTEEYQALYHESVYPMMAERDFVWGSFVWNMFDFTSPIRKAANIENRNIKGLVTFDRKTRKDSFYYYKAMWSSIPFVHIASKRFANRGHETMTVKVYSNQEQVTITVNKQQMTQPVVNGSAVFEQVSLEMGENKVVAESGKCRDEAVFVRLSQPDESYVYVDQNPGINVRNWFLDEQSEAELFPEGYLSIRCTINDLLASQEAIEVIAKRMPDVAKAIQDMVGTFTFEMFFKFAKPNYTEEEVKALNAELTKISIS